MFNTVIEATESSPWDLRVSSRILLTEMVSEIRSASPRKRQFRHSCKHRSVDKILSDESQRFLVNLHAKSRLLQQNFSITNNNEKHILIFATFENKKLTE